MIEYRAPRHHAAALTAEEVRSYSINAYLTDHGKQRADRNDPQVLKDFEQAAFRVENRDYAYNF